VLMPTSVKSSQITTSNLSTKLAARLKLGCMRGT
jgi:hypothetical protein